MSNALSKKHREEIIKVLQARFEKNTSRHTGIEWVKVQAKLENHAEKLHRPSQPVSGSRIADLPPRFS